MKVSIHSIIFFLLFSPFFLSATSCVPSHLELEQKKEVSAESDSNTYVQNVLPPMKTSGEVQEPTLFVLQESSSSEKEEREEPKKELEPLVETKKEVEVIPGSVDVKKTGVQKRTVVVHNKVTSKMTTYTHWGTSHTPTFTIRAHGKVIVPGIQDTLEIIDNSLKIEYHADFYGMRTSNDSADFILKPETKEVEITFSWDAKPRIIIEEI